MPSVLTNAPSDYLPADGFTQGSEASLKKLAKLVAKVSGDDESAIMQTLPSVQYYANNSLLHSKYVSPVLEDNLDGACPIMLVMITLNGFGWIHPVQIGGVRLFTTFVFSG